jgi:hypothetical protein
MSPRYNAFIQYRISVIQHRNAFFRQRNATRPRHAEKVLQWTTDNRTVIALLVLVVWVTWANWGSLVAAVLRFIEVR